MTRAPHTHHQPNQALSRPTVVSSVVNTSDANTVHPARSNGVHNRAEYKPFIAAHCPIRLPDDRVRAVRCNEELMRTNHERSLQTVTATVAVETGNSLMTKGEPQMSQTEPLSRLAVESVESLMEMFQHFMQDGRLCRSEYAQITSQMHEAHHRAMLVDDAQALSVSMMRNGPESQRTKRLVRQFHEDHDSAA